MMEFSELTRAKLRVACVEILEIPEIGPRDMDRDQRARAAYLEIVILGYEDPLTTIMAQAIAECLRYQLDTNQVQRLRVADVVVAYNVDNGFEIDEKEAILALRLLGCLKDGRHWVTDAGPASDFVPEQENVLQSAF